MLEGQGNIPDAEHADGSLWQDEAGEHEVGGGKEGDEHRGGVGAHGGGGHQHVPSGGSSVGIVISGCGRTHSVAELMTVPMKEMDAAATPPANSCPPTSILSLGVDMFYFYNQCCRVFPASDPLYVLESSSILTPILSESCKH